MKKDLKNIQEYQSPMHIKIKHDTIKYVQRDREDKVEAASVSYKDKRTKKEIIRLDHYHLFLVILVLPPASRLNFAQNSSLAQ